MERQLHAQLLVLMYFWKFFTLKNCCTKSWFVL
jgi:hypothetical protein